MHNMNKQTKKKQKQDVKHKPISPITKKQATLCRYFTHFYVTLICPFFHHSFRLVCPLAHGAVHVDMHTLTMITV